ncbi:S-layer homology domain-containing protein [Gracilibacillus boraciitolerans]|nr:S-layer homology domain-containing protein [Gracilibacillus boraciitolerans]
MKLKKTLIATLSLSVLIAPTLTGAESNQVTKADSAPPIKTFDDIQGHWGGQHNIEYLIDVGSINGFPDGTFRPDEPITRASAVKMIVSELGLPLDNSDSVFPDVTDKFWAKPYINTGKTEAIIKGYPNGNFGPKDLLTRGELASILVRAYNINLRDKDKALRFPDVKYKYWAYDDINALDQFGAVKGGH